MKKISQSKLADEIGVSKSHLSEIFSGIKNPSWDVAKRIGEYLNADPVIFMDGSSDDRCEALLKYQIDN